MSETDTTESQAVTSCDDCGVCCLSQGVPPGYDVILSQPKLWPVPEDHQRVANLPDQLRRELIDHLQWRISSSSAPCLWYDLVTRQCQHHEHRPSVCRDFAIGSPSCLSWRRTFDV